MTAPGSRHSPYAFPTAEFSAKVPAPFVASAAGRVHLFWRQRPSSVAVGNRNVYAVHMEYGFPLPRYSLWAFDKVTGAEQWTYGELRRGPMLGFCASPLVSDSVVIAGWGEDRLYAFDRADGAPAWEDSLDGDIVSSPAAGKLYVYDTDANRGRDLGPRMRSTPLVRITSRIIRVFCPTAGRPWATVFDPAGRRVYRVERMLDAGDSFTGSWRDERDERGM